MSNVARVLIIEDEAMLRNSMVLGLSKLPGVEALAEGTLDDALVLIDRGPPDLILSDLDLPSRSGVELIGELGKRGLHIPIVYVSAYVRAFSAQIPKHANVEVLEKPVALEELRRVVRGHLAKPGYKSRDSAPFGVIDYLQLSSLGRHSVVIEVEAPDGGERTIVVRKGTLWSAADPNGSGEKAFARIAFLEGVEVTCRTLEDDPGERTIETPMEALLLDAARLKDEGRPIGAPSAPAPSEPPGSEEAAVDPLDELERFLDDGLEAMLRHDYDAAFVAFTEAHRLQPENPSITVNLERLEELRKRPRE